MERMAFTELMMAVQCDKTKEKKRSEFVEDQAVESDEDDMLGFGGMHKKKVGKDDEEEDDHESTIQMVSLRPSWTMHTWMWRR